MDAEELVLDLVKETDPILKLPCRPWTDDNGIDKKALVKEMLSYMIMKGGIGLAAPQIGLDLAVFVIGNETNSHACFNPRLISVGKDVTVMQEGCLSYPGLYLNVKRPGTVVVEFEDIEGETKQLELSGIMARVFLHEYDHLMGICFTDRVGELSLKLAQGRRAKNLKKR
jgi:peptide deformylase